MDDPPGDRNNNAANEDSGRVISDEENDPTGPGNRIVRASIGASSPAPLPPPPPSMPPYYDPYANAAAAMYYYESQMRDHAVAYANAAARAAWAAASIAAAGNSFTPVTQPAFSPADTSSDPSVSSSAGYCYPQQQQIPSWFSPEQLSPIPFAYLPPPLPPPPLPAQHFQPVLHAAAPLDHPVAAPSDIPLHQRRKRQQRLPPDQYDSSSSSVKQCESSPMYTTKNRRRTRMASDGDNSSTSSQGSVVAPRHKNRTQHPFFKKKRSGVNSDESLLGKTAVAALYEFCGKRRTSPVFKITDESNGSDSFEIYVSLENDANRILGWGRGRNKMTAKQEAARRALSTLRPGVVFHPDTGLLLQLPPHHQQCDSIRRSTSTTKSTSASLTRSAMDELAPNLAQRLAIGQTQYESNNATRQQSKRSWGSFPETTTSTEEENESAYYASRGASMCSMLLHAMVQIDASRIPEPPNFVYHQGGVSTDRLAGPRSPFTCIATLKVLSLAVARQQHNAHDSEEEKEDEEPRTEQTLQAVSVGGTKREARHRASAKLLALLFPECHDDMAKVVEAAEAMREQYAASKQQLKHQQQKQQQSLGKVQVGMLHPQQHIQSYRPDEQAKITSGERSFNPDNNIYCRAENSSAAMEHALAHPNDPPMPRIMEQEFRKIFDQEHKQCQFLDESSSVREEEEEVEAELISSVSAVALSENEAWTSAVYRLASRESQLNNLVEIALQSLNERDEEGRTLPEELTESDVGRTVLRRAEEQDLPTLLKMFSSSENKFSTADGPSTSPRLNGRDAIEHSHHLSRINGVSDAHVGEATKTHSHSLTSCLLSLESSSFIVLLLCRAIAAYEHPPLGCAILNLGFSMECGRLLRVVRIASEPHLPRERFLEVLQNFSKTMKCGFETSGLSSQNVILSLPDLVQIVKSHVIADDEKPAAAKVHLRESKRRSSQASFQQLQAVREEDDESGVSSEEKEDDENEDSDPIEKRSNISSTKQMRNSSKPSKRSRVK